MAVSGAWTLFYDWGCSGPYSKSTVTFNNNGSLGEGGVWFQSSGMVMWRYNSSPGAVYAGNVVGGAMVGLSSTSNNGLTGCWYATAPGGAPAAALAATAKATAAAPREELDEQGNARGKK